jgi:hypothetical protein
MFGELEEGTLRMPRKAHHDARKLTWPKKLAAIAGEVINAPPSTNDCWYVPASKLDGYHETKISATGSTGKYRTHRMLRALYDPTAWTIVNDRKIEDHALHRCGRGKASAKGEPACINPHHICFADSAVNQDTKGCKYGAAFLCPHNPRCIWVDPATGRFKPCRNDPTKTQCSCDHKCSLISSVISVTILDYQSVSPRAFPPGSSVRPRRRSRYERFRRQHGFPWD